MKRLILYAALILTAVSCSNAQDVQHIDSKTFHTLINANEGIILDVERHRNIREGISKTLL